jgi:hypothetical protein
VLGLDQSDFVFEGCDLAVLLCGLGGGASYLYFCEEEVDFEALELSEVEEGEGFVRSLFVALCESFCKVAVFGGLNHS